jgi:Leucine-rich repeat (LRR) protein
MSSTVVARSPVAYRVLSDVDLVGLVVSALLDDDRGRATRAVHSLCLSSTTVRAAVLASVLASVQRVRMDAPLPAVLQQMTSLVSLHVGPGRLDPSQLPQLTRLQADGVSSLQALASIIQLTRLRELRLGIAAADGYGDTWAALHGISCLSSLSSLGMGLPEMQQLPDAIGQLTALTNLGIAYCSIIQQLPEAIGQLTALSSLDLGYCSSLQHLPETLSQLTALSSLSLLGICCTRFQAVAGIMQRTKRLQELGLSIHGDDLEDARRAMHIF